MNSKVAIKEGFISFRGYNTWYRIVGEPEKSGRLPLVCLHGGPGATWDYFEPLEALAETGRQILFYDQVGGGNSSVPTDPTVFTIEFFLEELSTVLSALGLEKIHLLGHSWGGMLALEYALLHPSGLASLILANTTASVPHWIAEVRRLVGELPAEVQQIIAEHEAAGTTDSPEYLEAQREFSRRHLSRRMDPLPDCFRRMGQKYGDGVYNYMWGPSEFHATGTLKDWDISNRLGEINLPTLVISGRYDEATPALNETLKRGISGSEWVLFEKSGHFPQLEETELYLQVLEQFMEKVEEPV